MPPKSHLLASSTSDELYSQLIELHKSEISITEKLFRCRQILESMYKHLTSNTNIAFTGLYARMQYIQEAYPISNDLIKQLQLLRLLTNKVVHKDDFKLGDNDYLSSLKVLSEAVHFFSGKPLPPEIKRILDKHPALTLSSYRTDSENTLEHVFGILTSWQLPQSKSGSQYLELKCQTSDGQELTITLWDRTNNKSISRNWAFLEKAIWKYCNISFYNLSAVHGVTNRYQSTPHTLVVLEPDFLIDVSSVADCFQASECYPELFIINRLISEPITPALAKGKCVNFIFDELIANPEKSLIDIFNEYRQKNPLHFFSLGSEAWNEIYKQIQYDHYLQLKNIAVKLHNNNVQLEPSFISTKYGIHGRLDVLSLPDQKTSNYSIIELKSGSAPAHDVWKAHQMQVVGYNIMIKEVFGISNIGNSSIFYSKSSDSPLRHIVNHIALEQEFLMCRNRIVGILQKMSTNPEIVLNWLRDNIRIYPNRFIDEKVRHIQKTLSSASTDEYKWLIDKMKYIFREIWATKTGAFVDRESGSYGFSSLWNCSFIEKKRQYRLIDNLWICRVDADKLIFQRQEESILSNIRVGDIVVLYKQDTPVNEQQLIRGTVILLDRDQIRIRTRSIIKEQSLFDKYTLWAIEPDLMESSLYQSISSVFNLLCSDKIVKNKLLGLQAPEFDNTETKEALSWRKDITECLHGMISAKDYYLIQGPPGTGKTSCLLLQYIQYIIADTEKNLIIISYTNRAIDEVCNHLLHENIPYLRLGSNGKQNIHSGKGLTEESIYGKNRIFVSTLHTFLAVAPELLQKITIDEMIVDEASQIQEHHIIGLMSSIPKTILIGDQNQLPPVIQQQTKRHNESILEILIKNSKKLIFPTCNSMLTNHYRMHNDITKLIVDYYRNKLIPGSKRQLESGPWLQFKNSQLTAILSSRTVWVDTKPSYQSKADSVQANWIKDFLDKLNEVLPHDEICNKVGIISPFRAQVQCILSVLDKRFQNLTIDTVERFQGSERDCIIMSYPIRYHHELSMLQSLNATGTIDRKLIVALSRAREQLIILGSSKILSHSEFFHKVFVQIKSGGLVINI